jgi:hypothetical protein
MKKNFILIVLLSFIMGLSCFSQISRNGLIAHYPFHGNANDEGCSGKNGTVSGATLTTDRFGIANEAYSFDGVNDVIIVDNVGTEFNPTDAISMSVFVKPLEICGGGTSGNIRIIRKAADGGGGYLLSWCNGTNNKLEIRLDGSTKVAAGIDETSLVGGWHHIVVTYNKSTSTAKIYVDNILKLTQPGLTYNFQNSDTKLYIAGSPVAAGDEYFKGALDDIRLYNRELTASEISSLYNEGIVASNITVTDTLVINVNLNGFNPITFQNYIKIYPNPSKNAITIDCGSNYSTLNGYTIKIKNSLDQTVYTSLVNTQITNIDLKTWSGKGIYFVYLIDTASNTVDIKKIILQ